MLNLTSRFVLQVLPYLLMALAAVVLLPAFADLLAAAIPAPAPSPCEIRTMIEPCGRERKTIDLIRRDHETFAPNPLLREIARPAEADFEYR